MVPIYATDEELGFFLGRGAVIADRSNCPQAASGWMCKPRQLELAVAANEVCLVGDFQCVP